MAVDGEVEVTYLLKWITLSFCCLVFFTPKMTKAVKVDVVFCLVGKVRGWE